MHINKEGELFCAKCNNFQSPDNFSKDNKRHYRMFRVTECKTCWASRSKMLRAICASKEFMPTAEDTFDAKYAQQWNKVLYT